MKILICFLISFQLLAVTSIKKGEVSNQDGFIFSYEEEKVLRENNEKLNKLGQLNTLKDEKIAIQDERITILKEQVSELKSVNTYSSWVYFVGGILVTIGSVYITSITLKGIK